MNERVLVVSPHPDDETLGCGGTLLKYKANGATLFWLNVTDIYEDAGWPEELVKMRKQEIAQVYESYGFSELVNLGIPPTTLDQYPSRELIDKISATFQRLKPTTVILPNPEDAHSDHLYVANAAFSCTKVFRYPSIKTVLLTEILSETEFGLKNSFRLNYFVDISEFLEEKIKIMRLYASELGKHPFPRSEDALRALSLLRGTQAGCQAAEAFYLAKHIYS